MKINSTPDVPVVYENPKHPLPEWANWMVKFPGGFCTAFETRPGITHYQTWIATGTYGNLVGYTIPGPWQDSLRRIVRLSEKAYYTPENPHTTGKGLLPHDGGVMPKWLEGKTVVVKLRDGAIHGPRGASAYMWCKSPCDHTSGDIIAYRIVGEQKDQRPELPNEGRNQEQEDVEEGLALLRKHSWDLYEKSGASEYVTNRQPCPQCAHLQRTIEAQTGTIEELRSEKSAESIETRPPSDATYPREAVQRAYEHGYRDGVDNTPGGPPAERRHRNELAARTLTPVPGMDDFMHDVIREARRHDLQVAALQGLIASNREKTGEYAYIARKYADAMIEKEQQENKGE